MSEVSEQAVTEGGKVRRRRHVRANAPNKAFTLPQLAADGPLCRSALYREIREGRLMARKAGRSTIVLAQDWDTFLRSLPRLGADVAAPEPSGPREARAKRRTITAS
jgi:hypothetical protein